MNLLKTHSKIQSVLEAFEKGNKSEVVSAVEKLSPEDMQELAKFAKSYKKVSEGMQNLTAVVLSPFVEGEGNITPRHDKEITCVEKRISDEEQKELSDEYGERVSTHHEDFIQYRGKKKLF